jgi:hypothetical protein
MPAAVAVFGMLRFPPDRIGEVLPHLPPYDSGGARPVEACR